MQIRNMNLDDYNEVDRLMAQVHQLHVNGRPDLYIDVEHISLARKANLKL